MVELTEREIALIHLMSILTTKEFASVDWDAKYKVFRLLLSQRLPGKFRDDYELKDFAEAINREQGDVFQMALGMIKRFL